MNRILIIDDDAELCALVARFLKSEGFDVDRAADGSHGIERALSGSYALVMLDVTMPGLSGFDVLRRIRARSRTPVLMLTARGDTHDRVLGLELGADDYLPKPYDPSELAARIRAILRRVQAAAGSAASAPLAVDDIELTASARAEIFLPFRRVQTMDAPNEGSGLGLAIAHRAIEANGGTIDARNGADGGLIVDIKLPISPAL